MMLYGVVVTGFLLGFGIALGISNVLLRHKTKEQLQNDKSIRTRYGLFVWAMGLAGGWLSVWFYNTYYVQ